MRKGLIQKSIEMLTVPPNAIDIFFSGVYIRRLKKLNVQLTRHVLLSEGISLLYESCRHS